MAQRLTAEDARQSLTTHVVAKGVELREKYGPHIGWEQLVLILQDRTCVRYPCQIVFDRQLLEPGEFAHPLPAGERPEDGFTIYVHPHYLNHRESVPMLVLYQVVLVNYGPFASAADAEIFGSTALGLARDEYYDTLCAMADELSGAASSPRAV